MRNYSKLSPFFWLKGSGKRLRGDAIAQVVAGYLSSCPDANMVGIFFVSLATIASHTGHPVEQVRAALDRIAAAKYAFYDFDAELVWIPNHAQFEIGDAMKTADKRRPKVLAELAQVEGHRFVEDFRSRYGSAYNLPANDSGKGHPDKVEGASVDQGQDKHRTGQTQDRNRSKGASAPDPEEPDRVFRVGQATSLEARDIFAEAVATATGRPFALSRAGFHTQELCDALNAHAPPDLTTKADVLRWLPGTVRVWCIAAEPKAITPAKFLEWLNAGRPQKPMLCRPQSGGGPRGDRQPLGDWRPPASIDDDPFAPTGSEGT